MARQPRIEYPGAIYHVINRGNYRRDVFGTVGAAKAFVDTLAETVKRYEWELGAYVVMRNHFHLAVRTPQPNLSAGMQWLQVTFASRFNRLRSEQGHLFQGRFKSILLEHEEVWARVADYIHLNPLRAGIVDAPMLPSFRWSSLGAFLKGDRFPGLDATAWLSTLGFADSVADWARYVSYLSEVHALEQGLPVDQRESYSEGWAIGDQSWKQQLQSDLAAKPAAGPKSEYQEPKQVQEARWSARLKELLSEQGLAEADLLTRKLSAKRKAALAEQLREEMGVPVVWLAEAMHWGKPAAVRTSLWRHRQYVDNVTT